MLAALHRHRVYIARTAWRDVRHRHVGSAAGAAWNILRPVALIAVFTIVFGQIMTGRDGDGFRGVHFTLYLCAALLPWTAFSEAVSRGTHALVGSAAYLRKLAIDEEVYVAQSVLSAGISLLISMVLLLGLAVALGQGPLVTWLLLPLPLALLLLFARRLGHSPRHGVRFVRDCVSLWRIALLIGSGPFRSVRSGIVPEWFRRRSPLIRCIRFFTR
ncbi:MAG: ABC transporter permease [Phycisphaeraceae bacterium]|nr:ABC transporter permease [Phycisphaeraceae bacterium]